MKSIRLEQGIMIAFIGLSALFTLEFIHFVQSGRWVIHAGAAGFSQWPQPIQQNLSVLLHSIGMLLWIAIVIYQLKTRGKKAHIWVGRFGASIMIIALILAWGPAVASTVPALHALAGLTLIDITLIVNFIGVVIETVIGILKARDKRMLEHRQHLLVAIMFIAAPGLYRLLFILISNAVELSNSHPITELQALWAHELAACLAILAGACLLVSRTFSGHITVITESNTRRPRPFWHKALANVMIAIGIGLIGLFSIWSLDLLLMDLESQITSFTRNDAPNWIHYYSISLFDSSDLHNLATH